MAKKNTKTDVKATKAPAKKPAKGAAKPAAKEYLRKKELISVLSDKSGFTKVDSEKFLAAFVETLTDAAVSGKCVGIPGFGTFSIKDVAQSERMSFGKKTVTPAHRTVKFKLSSVFKEKLAKK